MRAKVGMTSLSLIPPAHLGKFDDVVDRFPWMEEERNFSFHSSTEQNR
jgi:hypothetical protein